MASFLSAVSTVHCTPVSLGQGGEGLGTVWGWETAEVGYEDPVHFRRIFRRLVGETPGRYRRRFASPTRTAPAS